MFLTSRMKVLDTLVGVSVDSIPSDNIKIHHEILSVFYKALSKCCAVGTLVTCFFYYFYVCWRC